MIIYQEIDWPVLRQQFQDMIDEIETLKRKYDSLIKWNVELEKRLTKG